MAEIIFRGGLNEQDDINVDPQECTAGYNFELGIENTHFRPRKPFDLIDTATGQINGFLQLIKVDGTKTTLIHHGATVSLWDGTTFTSKGTVTAGSKLRGTYWPLDDELIITDINKKTVVQNWDGTSLTTQTTGLGSDLYAKYAIVHRGRVWLFNVKSGSDTPHLMVASAYEDPTDYSLTDRAVTGTFTTGLEAFFMHTPDLKPINGAVLFKGELIISTEAGRLYKLTGSDADDYAWVDFYADSAAIGDESIANTGNDVIFMRKGGVIESLKATEAFGDVETDDLSRWIRDTTSELPGADIVYDQVRQKVYFFVPSSNFVLVMWKDMLQSGLSPWSKYTTQHTSNFVETSVTFMESPTTTDKYVYWGDADGNIFQMDGTVGGGDAGSDSVKTYRRSGLIDWNPNERVRGRLEYRRISTATLIVEAEWADDYQIAQCSVPLEAPPDGDYFGGSCYFGGEFYFNSGFFYSRRISTKGLSFVGRGPGFYLHTQIDTTNDFDVISINDETQRVTRQAV